jgi:hypothetical protein
VGTFPGGSNEAIQDTGSNEDGKAGRRTEPPSRRWLARLVFYPYQFKAQLKLFILLEKEKELLKARAQARAGQTRRRGGIGGLMFYEAKKIFDDPKKYINPETDPVHWDLLNGLSELAMSLRSLEEKIERIEQHVKQQR